MLALPLVATPAPPEKVRAFSVTNATTTLSDGVYLLDADIAYRLSDDAIEALDNGVALTIVREIEIQHPRRFWFPKRATRIVQREQLDYRALSGLYVLTDLESAQQRNYPSRAASIAALGTITAMPLVEQRVLDSITYHIRIRTYLDIDTLPLPLRPLAYLSSEWQLRSDWHTWPLGE